MGMTLVGLMPTSERMSSLWLCKQGVYFVSVCSILSGCRTGEEQVMRLVLGAQDRSGREISRVN